MFLLKIMSNQNLPDNDMTKNYKMIAIGSGDQFEFYHDPGTGLPMAQVVPKEGESYSVELTGNAYVVSETGKTVSSHWARSLWGRSELKGTVGADASEVTVTEKNIEISSNTRVEVTAVGTNSDIIAGGRKAFPLAAEEKPAPSVHDQAVAELARRALLNEANPNPEPKVTYTA